jgi:alpha-tubulin suppressor-like RCC1 family protein
MRLVGAGAVALMSAVAATGCGADGQTIDRVDESRELGDVSLGLLLPDGTNVTSVDFLVTRNGVEVRSGSMQVGADGRASIILTDLDAGDGYRVRLSTARDAGSFCEGEADFTVRADMTSNVNVILQCSDQTVDGNVSINGSFNICPKVTSTTVSPVTVAVGSSAAITAAASDRDGDVLSFSWSASDGTFSAQTALDTQYTCASAGDKTLTLSVTDGPNRGCTRNAAISITCVGGLDGGVDGGTDGGAPDGGVPNSTTLTASFVSAGPASACAVQLDGRLVCWGAAGGAQGNGALGNGSDSMGATAVDTRKLPQGLATTWKSVDLSQKGGCGITTAGVAYCWGGVALGDGNREPSYAPRALDASRLPAGATWSLVTVAGNDFFGCGITSDGAGYCWGLAQGGATGTGLAAGNLLVPTPVDMSGLPAGTKWAVIDAGNTHACGITTEGNAYCWGQDGGGQLGNGAVRTNQLRPAAVDMSTVPAATRWTAISAGNTHTCALTTTGAIYCWGADAFGQLGNGTARSNSASPTPIDVTGLPAGTTWTQLASGFASACALATSGTLYCWGGFGADGVLGNGGTANQQSAVAVDMSALPAGTQWRSVSNNYAVCGLTTQNEVYCWGVSLRGQIANAAAPNPVLRPQYPAQLTYGILFDDVALGHALGDPNNPTLPITIVPAPGMSPDGFTFSVTSSNEALFPASIVAISGAGVQRSVSFHPTNTGVATFTFTVTAPDATTKVFAINYAVTGQSEDTSGAYHYELSNASSAIDVGDGHMLVCDDEINVIYLFKQNESSLPLKSWSLRADDRLSFKESDLEGSARTGNTVLWVSSQGNDRGGEIEETRRALIAMDIVGSGANTELTFHGRYGAGTSNQDTQAAHGLRNDLITWDVNSGHGLGANYLKFVAGSAAGVRPNAPNGFNVEGLEFALDGRTGLLGFRAPTIEREGKQMALIVPVPNILDLVDGVPAQQTGLAQFGAPIFLDLAGRSIRELRRNEFGEYLISAGPPDSPTVGVNDTWALYSWDGNPAHGAVFNRELPTPNFGTGGVWESIVSVPHPLTPGATVRLVADSGDTFLDPAAVEHAKSYSRNITLN